MTTHPDTVADAVHGNWVDTWAPEAARPYLRLARMDRPIGTWLLLWPCLWGSALAASASGTMVPDIWHMVLFAIGATVMRGAGCTFNDLVDRDYDGRVARTALRPIPSGQISTRQAILFMIALCMIGFLVLIQFNTTTIMLGIASLAIVAVYPFMKRFTNWPQVVLGLAFNWGALLGWAAARGELDWTPVILYAGAIAWTIGYDTIYAHQDKEDDALIGLKSTALHFGEKTGLYLTIFYAIAWIGIFAAGWLAGGRVIFAVAMAGVAGHFAWQIATLRTGDPDNCLQRFRANHIVGLLVFAGLALDTALRVAATSG
ncbi:MAG: 4-hydroxybenzoate octaprenyltransferase [Hyphomicrobiaceae bacterium]